MQEVIALKLHDVPYRVDLNGLTGFDLIGSGRRGGELKIFAILDLKSWQRAGRADAEVRLARRVEPAKVGKPGVARKPLRSTPRSNRGIHAWIDAPIARYLTPLLSGDSLGPRTSKRAMIVACRNSGESQSIPN